MIFKIILIIYLFILSCTLSEISNNIWKLNNTMIQFSCKDFRHKEVKILKEEESEDKQ